MEKEKMKNEIMSLFSTPFVKTIIGRDFTKDELQFLLSDIPMHKDEKKGMQNHQSKDNYLFDNFTEELKDIKNFCEYQLKNYLEHIEGANTNLATLRITQSWLNKTKPGEHHSSHTHPNSYLSGVLYITCLPNDHINLVNRSFGLYNNIEFQRKKITPWNSTGTTINVIEGDLILFPSWVLHYVDKNNTDKERISLSFDTFPIGEMGKYDGGTHFLKLG